MGKQLGILPLKATMDNMTFYQSKDGMRVKKQTKISKERIQNDKNFAKLRKNNIEFTNAARAAKLLRISVTGILSDVTDGRVVSRLFALMVKAAKADMTNPRGERNVLDGDLHFLEGFNFNVKSHLNTVLKASFVSSVDRVTGKLEIQIPSFTPATMLEKPKDATHFKLISAGTELDFPGNVSVKKEYESDFLPLNNVATAVIDIVHQLTANNVHPLFLLLGVTFFSKVNGDYEPAGGLEFNALSIVAISTL